MENINPPSPPLVPPTPLVTEPQPGRGREDKPGRERREPVAGRRRRAEAPAETPLPRSDEDLGKNVDIQV